MTRKQYYHAVYVHKQRRVKYKRLFKETKDEKYRTYYTHQRAKIKALTKQIKIIDERNKKLNRILLAINRYFNLNVNSDEFSKKHQLARNIYYKYAMESNLRGQWVSKFIGRHGRMAELGRASLTKSFQTKQINREAFYGFKKYYEN